MSRLIILLFCLAAMSAPAVAADDAIEGVQAAALDQPRVYVNLRRTANAPALKTSGQEQLTGIEAFLDTGASGSMLSTDTVKKLGIQQLNNVIFEDVGVAGSEKFHITEPLFVSMAPYPKSDPETATYSQPIGPYRMQIRPGGGLLDLVAPGLDVVGVPTMAGKVVVMDPKPLANFDKIQTSVYPPGDRNIPKTSRHVPLTPVSWVRFTRIQPKGATGPDLSPNPMIGPDPFKPGDPHAPVRASYRGNTVSGTFLLDTGAVTSVISTKLAQQLNMKIADSGALPDVPKQQQFQLTIGGLGGGKQATGTFFDRVELPTREGRPLAYVKAPLLISDVTVVDQDGKPYTLDGIIGMNYLVASAEVTGGLLPDIGKIVDGPFRWIVIDLKQSELGLEPRADH